MSTKEDMMKCGGPPANAPSYEEAIGYQHNLPSTNMPTNLLTYEPYTPYPPMEPMVIQPQQLQQQPPSDQTIQFYYIDFLLDVFNFFLFL